MYERLFIGKLREAGTRGDCIEHGSGGGAGVSCECNMVNRQEPEVTCVGYK